jgi:hypothetical protein
MLVSSLSSSEMGLGKSSTLPTSVAEAYCLPVPWAGSQQWSCVAKEPSRGVRWIEPWVERRVCERDVVQGSVLVEGPGRGGARFICEVRFWHKRSQHNRSWQRHRNTTNITIVQNAPPCATRAMRRRHRPVWLPWPPLAPVPFGWPDPLAQHWTPQRKKTEVAS